MKNVVRPWISRRPIREYEEVDLQKMTAQIAAEKNMLDDLRLTIEAKETNPEYQRVLLDSQKRLEEIAQKCMALPVRADNLLIRAEMIGQYNERKLLTEELLCGKKLVAKKESWITRALRRVENLAAKLRKESDARSK